MARCSALDIPPTFGRGGAPAAVGTPRQLRYRHQLPSVYPRLSLWQARPRHTPADPALRLVARAGLLLWPQRVRADVWDRAAGPRVSGPQGDRRDLSHSDPERVKTLCGAGRPEDNVGAGCPRRTDRVLPNADRPRLLSKCGRDRQRREDQRRFGPRVSASGPFDCSAEAATALPRRLHRGPRHRRRQAHRQGRCREPVPKPDADPADRPGVRHTRHLPAAAVRTDRAAA